MLEDFHEKRLPFYIDSQSLLIKFPTKTTHINGSHAKWFSEIDYPYLHTIRGYLMEGSDPHIMIYWNDFEIPNVDMPILTYLFEYFPNINWIGIGCNKGKIGEEWSPKLKIVKA